MAGAAQDTDPPPPLVRNNADRFDAPLRFLNGRFDLKVSARDTDGALCIIDTLRSEPGGPPLHLHDAQDEWFFVVEGSFVVQVGSTTHHLGPGDSVLGPRGIPHAFANTSPTGRLIVLFQPAGSMERFFKEGSEMGKLTPETFRTLSEQHGMRVVGPPLNTA